MAKGYGWGNESSRVQDWVATTFVKKKNKGKEWGDQITDFHTIITKKLILF